MTSPLLPQHMAQLDASSISKEVAEARGYRSVERKSELRDLGFSNTQQLVPALVIPIWDVTGQVGLYHHRPDTPRMRDGKTSKYEFPARSHMVVDVHPFIKQKVRDPNVPLFITEGVKKADAAISRGLCCIALAGTWNWRGTNEHGGKAALPDWDSISLKGARNDGRQVYLCFDSDVMLKPEVNQALVRLSGFLKQRGARVAYIYLPCGEGAAKMGLDDFFATGKSIDNLMALATTELRKPSLDDAKPDEEGARQAKDSAQAALRERAQSVLDSNDPFAMVEQAVRDIGFGGDIGAAMLTYLAATSRLLLMRQGAMPVHTLLIGPASSGKTHALKTVQRLLPPDAYHVIDAGSPSVLIYDDAALEHRMLVFSEADSLPAGEDSPAASAVRNLCQDHYLHYQVTVRDKETGDFTVKEISKPGPTVLVTTSTRKLGHQLDSRLFSVEVADDQKQIRAALTAQAHLEMEGGTDVPDALIAYQALLQTAVPWDVIVPFAGRLAHEIGRSPAAPRLLRDFARLISLVKALAVLRHTHRMRSDDGRLVATLDDYRTVYEHVKDVYSGSVSDGASNKVREVVAAVQELKAAGVEHITVTAVAEHMGSENINKMAASRRITTAERGGWLRNKNDEKGKPKNIKDLDIGEPLPAKTGLPTPEMLAEEDACNSVTPHTVRGMGGSVRASVDEAHTHPAIEGTVNTVTPLHDENNGNGNHTAFDPSECEDATHEPTDAELVANWHQASANNSLFKRG